MTLPQIITDNSITVVLTEGPKTVTRDHPNFALVREELRNGQDPERIRDLMDLKQALIKYSDGRVQVGDDVVLYDGQPIDDRYLTRYILRMMQEGFDISPFCRFLERLQANPDRQLVESGDISWFVLESAGYPIDADGYLLVPKGVMQDYKSMHDRRTDNSPGNVVSMPREMVTKDPYTLCASGLHLGNWHYVQGWGTTVVLCRLDPADIVSTPYEYKAEKLRVCRYEVLRELTEYRKEAERLQNMPVVNDHNGPGEYEVTVEWITQQGETDQEIVTLEAESRSAAMNDAKQQLWHEHTGFTYQNSKVINCYLIEAEEDPIDDEDYPVFRVKVAGLDDEANVHYGWIDLPAADEDDAREEFEIQYSENEVFGVEAGPVDLEACRIYSIERV